MFDDAREDQMDAVASLALKVKDVVGLQPTFYGMVDQTLQLAQGQGGQHRGVGEGIHRTSKLLGCAVLRPNLPEGSRAALVVPARED
jgi:hypothetical protein